MKIFSNKTKWTKNPDNDYKFEVLNEMKDDSEPIPPCFTTTLKQVKHKFGSTKRYTKQSLIDAVQTYYDNKGWNPAAIRALKITMSNCSRDNTRVRHTKPGWTMPDHQRAAISKALKGKHWKVIDGKRIYTC